jgi:two-component system, chemotaxis family, chemotaxis protein CheY
MTSRIALIVDDSETMRQLLVYAVQRIPDLEAVEASDGVEALTHAAELRPDIIITDINMPVMDGLKLVQRLREEERFNDVPIVVVTTEAGAEDRNRAMELGANAYITKPIQGPKVVKLVRELLDL